MSTTKFFFFFIIFVCLEFHVVSNIKKQFYTLLYFCQEKHVLDFIFSPFCDGSIWHKILRFKNTNYNIYKKKITIL
jgi:hypothetical protein